MIQGTASSAGKTTLVTALCRIFVEKGFSVAPFKAQNMSNYAYKGQDFEISRAQAIQALASRIEISADLNPILLKPLGDYRSSVFVRGKFYKKMHADDYYKKFVQKDGMKAVLKSFHALEKKHDLIIIEGAGSPAEINLTKYDIANMKLAEKTNSPVILITDIERGGSFGSVVGTISLLEKKYQRLIKGVVFNKFRGDLDILKPGFRILKQKTGKSVLGTIPMTKFLLPEEDSITSNSKRLVFNKQNFKKIDSEIDKLSKVVKSSLNIRAIEKLL
ncbi:MAG: cobyric acid synthase [Thaumarchaeota archaeon]|jgi:adenosylcobyric acid synthase|uniref:Probable cobyric acid synthase n=1 Tax=uncultured marine thaumarchaeote SAT1000_23_E11 TaxID=1456396 RepID=A0A075I7U1_9ARCH|nr:Cobyrinic acid ac-diamide synthase (cobQ, cbiP) [uncultured marine thaumarchaeote SAT1000_23_E11]RZD36111.1 MAG: cobyric acid synthase [Nitrososphaerota archaeon]